MNPVIENILARSSIREFKKEKVDSSKLDLMLQAAIRAPNASNQQSWTFIVIRNHNFIEKMAKEVEGKLYQVIEKLTDPKKKEALHSYGRYLTFFRNAPLLIAVTTKPYDSYFNKIAGDRILEECKIEKERASPELQSVAAAIENILLAANSLGYGGCWMTGPLIARKELESMLQIREHERLVALIPIGKPSESAEKRPQSNRKSLGEVVRFID